MALKACAAAFFSASTSRGLAGRASAV